MNPAPAAFSGSVPDNYDRFLGPLLFEPYAVDLVSRIRHKPGLSILEVACGTGRVTHHLTNHFSAETKITATDLNPGMLQVAKVRVPHDAITWMAADMLSLPFEDETFDTVICQFGVMFVPDKAKAFSEISRVLKSGGTFLFNTWDKIENNGFMHVAHQVVTNFFGKNPPSFYSIPYSMYNAEELNALSLNNGFRRVKVDLVKKDGRSNSLHAAKGAIEGNPIHKEMIDIDPGAVALLIELVQKEMAATFGDDPLISPLQAWVGEAQK
jgi:ubiquinone/menaquinone biosynthesis C-methylase UbiE